MVIGSFHISRTTATVALFLLSASLHSNQSKCFVAASQSLVSQPTWPIRAATATNTSALLEDFQVYPPVRFEQSNGDGIISPNCEQILVEYSFANSYGNPFIGSLQVVQNLQKSLY